VEIAFPQIALENESDSKPFTQWAVSPIIEVSLGSISQGFRE